MRYPALDPDLFRQNRALFAARMKPDAVAVFVSNDIMPTSADGVLRFAQSSDLFWLTGIDQEESILILQPSANDPQDRERLYVRETSDLIRIWEGDKLTLEQAGKVSGIANVQWTNAFEPALRRILSRTNRIYLNANEHPRAPRDVQTREERFLLQCQSLYPRHHYERAAPILHSLRCVKSDTEIALIQQACDITHRGFERILRFVKPGVMEYEIEAEFLHEFLQHRSRGFAYSPIIASGPNACALHYLENNGTCKDGELLLLDVAAEYANYNSDLTRTIPVNGRFTDRQRAVYNAVLRVFQACRDKLLKPNLNAKDYQKQVGRLMEEELLSLDLLDPKTVAEERAKDDTEEPLKEEQRSYRKYFMHGTTHPLGLDVHDVSPADNAFREGMVCTIEPGIYLREEGFGVRLENDVVVRADGNIDLMANIPIEAEDIEAQMAESACT